MDLESIQRKISCLEQTRSSFSQALSLPLDFIVSFVKNRREAELLLKVSEVSSTLDLLIQAYEEFASTTQALQEAWNSLWLAQQPYVVPAIPLIGHKMSGVNNGRSVLLEKIDGHFNILKELRKQLCHYVDVNHSLVEELQMEGIDRLAGNKLLLVEVERELVRRISDICNSKSLQDFSSMSEFLCKLRKPSSTILETDIDESKDCANSITNGSCSTERITTDGSSEAPQRRNDRDFVSPDSQSFGSKCVSTERENIHAPGITTPICKSLPEKLDYMHACANLVVSSSNDPPLGTEVSMDAIQMKQCAHKHSSSASEERLPKTSEKDNKKPYYTSTDINFEYLKGKDDREEKQSETLDVNVPEHLNVKVKQNMPEQANGYENGTIFYKESIMGFNNHFRGETSKVQLTQDEMNAESLGGCDSGALSSKLLTDNMEVSLNCSILKIFDPHSLNQTFNNDFPNTQSDIKGCKRKHLAQCEVSMAADHGENPGLVERECKRVMIQATSASTRAIMNSSPGTLMSERKGSIERSNQSLLCIEVENGPMQKSMRSSCLPSSYEMSAQEGALDNLKGIQNNRGSFPATTPLMSNHGIPNLEGCIDNILEGESPVPATQ
ncbi:hypothetical protein KP509_23G006400 [Ceratopteris richardii]|uniref:Uncharacterized protein n=1 Tax=Ceratopteris richardii TaxID=49495 RepID=A0A8T2RWW5_CERRI|nr:hypothetical protein KP509_23G006400 [Ceratopteris richardii]